MRLLVLGGTVFLGRAIVEEALARRDDVTILHRGEHNPKLFGVDVDERIGDRRIDLLDALGEWDEWDLVIDTCGYDPADVALSAEFLAERCRRYVYISALAAYRDWPRLIVDEQSPTWPTGTVGYGGLKADCERVLQLILPGRSLSVRAGVLLGAHEYDGRLPRWLRRAAHGGYMLAPGPPDAPIQVLDVRDLAAYVLATRQVGVLNVAGAPGHATWGSLLSLCVTQGGPHARLRWVDPRAVFARVPSPWLELPLWPPPTAATAGLYLADVSAAVADGFVQRPLLETVGAVWAWMTIGKEDDGRRWRLGAQVDPIDVEAERALLAAIDAAGPLKGVAKPLSPGISEPAIQDRTRLDP